MNNNNRLSDATVSKPTLHMPTKSNTNISNENGHFYCAVFFLSNICIQNRFVSRKKYFFFFFTSDLNSMERSTRTRTCIIPLSIFIFLLFSFAIIGSFSFFTECFSFFLWFYIFLRFFDFENDIEHEFFFVQQILSLEIERVTYYYIILCVALCAFQNRIIFWTRVHEAWNVFGFWPKNNV